MPGDPEKEAKDAENMRRYQAIIAYDSAYWIARTGVYDEDDLQDIKFETIDESFFSNEIEDFDVDGHWARGWTNEGDHFQRNDSYEASNTVTHRAFQTRYRLEDFRLSKSLRRVFNRNRDLKIYIRPIHITNAMNKLHRKYDKRFHDFFWKSLSFKYPWFNHDEPTRLMQTAVFHQKKLLAFSIFQLAKYSVTGDMACWDYVDHRDRSLGILTALLEMRYAARKGYKYYYLADYTRHNPVSHYKTRFPGLEFYDWDNDRWIDAKTPEAEALLDQKLNYYYGRNEVEHYFVLIEFMGQFKEDIVATAVIGSHANGTARDDSDIDVIYLTTDVEKYINDETADFARRFGSLREQKIENWGAVKTIRAFYKSGLEIEFNFASPAWAKTDPVDEGTRRVVAGGMKILDDPNGILEKLQTAVVIGSK
jgi:uncharacterized protein